MSEITPEKVAATPPDPENVAEFLAYCANDAMDDGGNLWFPIVKAEGGVVELAIKPGDEDGTAMDDIVHFRAVVVKGETVPLVLDRERYRNAVEEIVQRFATALATSIPLDHPHYIARLRGALWDLAEAAQAQTGGASDA